MKILINKTDKNILPVTKIYDLGSVTTTIDDLLNESTIILEKNITPILSIDGSNYLINNFNSTNIKEDFETIITESDLISIGGSGGYEPSYKVYTALLKQTEIGGNPSVIVFQDELGVTLDQYYEGYPGEYGFTINGGFPENNTFIPEFGRLYNNGAITYKPLFKNVLGGIIGYYTCYYFNGYIYTVFIDNEFNKVDLASFEDVIGTTEIPIEIRVYN